MAGSRYTMQFEVTGNAKSGLKELENGVGRVQSQANKLNGAFGGLNKQGDKLGSIANSSRAGALMELGDQLEQQAQKFLNFTNRIVEGSQQMVMSIIQDASAFEDTQSSLKFAFGADWENVFQKVKDEAANLTFTFDQVANLAASMGRMKINPFGTTGKDLAVFKGKTGEALSALQILQDVSDATGRDTEKLMFSLRNAMSGQYKSLKEAVDMPADSFKKLTGELDKAKDPQEKYNILIKQLGEYFGGAGAAKAKNWSKAIAQVPDLLQQLRAGIGAEGLKALTPALFELVDALGSLVKDKEAMAALGGAFKMIAEVLASMIRLGAKAVLWLKDIIKAAPWLPKLVLGFVMLAAAGSLFIGVGLSLAATLATIIAMVALIGIKVIAIAAAITLALLPVIIAMGLAFGVVALLVYAVFSNINKGAGGSMSALQKIKLVLEALGEIFSSYDGKTGKLSESTAQALEKAGLLGFVTDLFKIYHRIRTFVSSFIDTMSEIGDKLAPVIMPMLDELKMAFLELMDTFGLSSAKTKAAGSDTKSWAEAGMQLANAIITVVGWLAKLITFGAHIFRMANSMGLVKAVLVLMAVYAAAFAIALGLAAVAALLLAAPFLLIGYLIYKAIEGIMKMTGLLKDVPKVAIGGIGGAVSKVVGGGGEAAPGTGTGTRVPEEKGESSYNKLIEGYGEKVKGGASLDTATAMPKLPPAEDKVSPAVEKGNGTLQAILGAIQGLDLKVLIDGDEIQSRKATRVGGAD